MAIYSVGEAERRAFQSANAYRMEVAAADQAKRTKELMDQIEKDAKFVAKAAIDTTKQVVHKVDKNMNRGQDRQVEEIAQNFKDTTNFVVGMALVVASCAAESAYNKSLIDAQDVSNRLYNDEVNRKTEDITQKQTQTLSEYTQRLEDTRQQLEADKSAHYVEYREARDEARRVIENAKQEYEKERNLLAKEEKRSDSVYRKEVDAANDSLRNANSVRETNIQSSLSSRDAAIQSAQSQYNNDVQRIKSEYPSGADRDRELRKAVERRTELESRARETHDANVRKYDSDYNKQADAVQVRIDVASQRHANEIKSISDRVAAAETKRSDVVNHQNDVISASLSKYKESTSAARTEHTNAQNKLAAFQNSSLSAMGDANVKNQALADSSKYNANADGVSLGRGAKAFVNAVSEKHNQIGHDLAIKFGSKDEIDLIKKVDADLIAQRNAKSNGSAYVPTTTNEERRLAKQTIQSYAGDIRTEKGVKSTIERHTSSLRALTAESNSISQAIEKKSADIKALDIKIAKEQGLIKQISEDKLALQTNKGANGVKLTAEQRQKIEARLHTNGNAADRAKKISDLIAKKNAASKDLSGLQNKLTENNDLIAGVKYHIQLLRKDGKAISNTMSHGGGVMASALQVRGTRMIFKSIDSINKTHADKMNRGNTIRNETVNMIKSMDKVSKNYTRALKIANFAIKGLTLPAGLMVRSGTTTLRVIGNNTRLGQSLNAKWQDFATKHTRLINGMQKVGQFNKGAKRVAGKVIMAPAKILSAPQKLMNLPQTLKRKAAKGAFRLARKTAGVVGSGVNRMAKGTARVVGSGLRFGINHTVGRTKWYQKASSRMQLFRERMGSFVGNIKDKFNIKGAIKRKLASFAYKIFGALISLITTIASALGYLFGLLFLFVLIMLVFFIIIALLLSVLAAIANWWRNTKASEKALIKNNPHYIVSQAVNYRNAELDILELVYQYNQNNIEIEVNEAPIYYELYDNESSFVKLIGRWFGWIPDREELENKNEGAKAFCERLNNRFEFHSMPRSGQWTSSNVKNYNNFKLRYYPTSELARTNTGEFETEVRGGQIQYVLKQGAQASTYEISNAKDALSMVDALYSGKEKNMQRLEVLAYLGVGNAQLATPAGNGADAVIANNLFWATHKFIYKSGNEKEDIWFHVTSETPTESNDGKRQTYKINSNYKYFGAGKKRTDDGKMCENYETVTLTYTAQVPYEVEVFSHYEYGGTEWIRYNLRGRHNFRDCPYRGDRDVSCDHIRYYYVQEEIWEPVYKTEIRYKDERRAVVLHVCKGHIDLDVAMVVTTIDDEELMFDEAMTVKGLEQDTPVASILGLFTWDPQQDVLGRGTLTQKAFHPYEDWAENSEVRNLALAKVQVENVYQLKKDQDVNDEAIKTMIYHYPSSSFKALQQSPKRELLLGMSFCGKLYYVGSFVSGEQKEMEYYLQTGSGNFEKSGLVSFAIATPTGTPYTIYQSLPSE